MLPSASIITIVSLLVAIIATIPHFYQTFLLKPKITYSIRNLHTHGHPHLNIAVKRAGSDSFIDLKNAIKVKIRSDGRVPASDVQVRLIARPSSIIQINVEENLGEAPPDIGRQSSSDMLVTIPHMVRGEEVSFSVWYGSPTPLQPNHAKPIVRVRHADGPGYKLWM
jgi:hypothetical protein